MNKWSRLLYNANVQVHCCGVDLYMYKYNFICNSLPTNQIGGFNIFFLHGILHYILEIS